MRGNEDPGGGVTRYSRSMLMLGGGCHVRAMKIQAEESLAIHAAF